MSEKETFVTEEGLQKLQDEFDHLVTVKRKEIVTKIKEARAHGDLSENSEYDSARDEQAFVESRITQLEKIIRNAKIIDATKEENDVVSIGKKVIFQEIPDGDREEYKIVGSAESDPASGKISNDSPMAKALLGSRKGEQIMIQTPAGEMKVKIIEVNID